MGSIYRLAARRNGYAFLQCDDNSWIVRPRRTRTFPVQRAAPSTPPLACGFVTGERSSSQMESPSRFFPEPAIGACAGSGVPVDPRPTQTRHERMMCFCSTAAAGALRREYLVPTGKRTPLFLRDIITRLVSRLVRRLWT
jgi:hypothetical protein